MPERKFMRIKEINTSEIEKKIGYVFKDKSLLIQAFTRTSFCNEHAPSQKTKYQSNEVLEFFGDGVLSVAIISFLLKECTERYPYGIKTDLGEGDFSNIKSKLSDKQNLSKSMSALGLQKYLRMGEGDEKLGIANEPSVMEDLFESIVGAIYIDSDMNISAVISAVSTMLDMSVYTDRKKPIQSAKNALQEWCADKSRRLPTPRYETLSEDGPDHKKTYMRGCYIGDKLIGRGIGKNFKIADAAAAEDALNTLMAENSANSTTKVVKTTNSVDNSEKRAPSKAAKKTTTQSQEAQKVSEAATEKSNRSPLAVLKAYASSQKISTAVFKDLGEIKKANTSECRVECLFSGESVIGSGKTRSEARENSASAMVELIGIGKKKTKAKPTAQRSSDNSKKAKVDPSAKNGVSAKPSAQKRKKQPYKKKSGRKTAEIK